MWCRKSFGEHITSRDPNHQAAEIHMRITFMSRFHTLRTDNFARAL